MTPAVMSEFFKTLAIGALALEPGEVRPRLHFIDDDGMRLVVTNLFDRFDNEITDVSKAAKVVAKLPDGQFLAATCGPNDIEYLQ